MEQQLINPRSAPPGRGAGWILEGFNYFKAGPLGWVAYVIVLFILGLLSALVPIVGWLLYEVLNFILLGGLMLGCRAVDTTGRFQFRHVFSGFGSDKVGQLALVGVIFTIALVLIFSLMALMIFIQFDAGEVLAQIWDSQSAEQQEESINALFAGKEALLVLVLLVGVALYLPIIMATWMAPALIVLEKVNAVPAMILSFRACLVNIIPFLVYGVVTLILLIIAALPSIVVGLLGVLSIIADTRIITVSAIAAILLFFLCGFILMPMIQASQYITYKDTLSS